MVGGYYLVEAADDAAALELAKLLPRAPTATSSFGRSGNSAADR